MEDPKQSRTQPAANKEEKILDLTKDMELADQEKHKIFDLAESLDPSEAVQAQEPSPPPVAPPADSAAEEITPQIPADPTKDPAPVIEEDAPTQPDVTPDSEDSIQEDSIQMDEDRLIEDDLPLMDPTPPEPVSVPPKMNSDIERDDQADEPELSLDETVSMPDAPDDTTAMEETSTIEDTGTTSIEDEVNAAFDEVQSQPPPAEPPKESSDQLFDKLSGITQMVDNAVRDINKDDMPQDTPSESIDNATLTSDAAELEAAISGGEDEEEIIELTEIVDPTEITATSDAEDTDDDIIDLVDIVDPAELEATSEEEVSGIATMDTADQIDRELETIDGLDSDASTELVSESDEPPPPVEEELLLSDLDEFDPDKELDKDLDEHDDFDTTEIDKLFGDDDFLGEETTTEEKPSPLDQQDEDEEQVILLSDVLQEGANNQQTPTAEVKEEDMAGEHLIEDTDVEADAASTESAPPHAKEQADLSNLNIEAAVEHLLKTKYADTIQQMVADAVQKAVTREVDSIKRGLSDKGEPDA